jgi:hypothetical protein
MDKRVHLKFNLLNKSYSSGIVKDCENIYENECVSTIILSPFTAMLQRMPGSGPNANLPAIPQLGIFHPTVCRNFNHLGPNPS